MKMKTGVIQLQIIIIRAAAPGDIESNSSTLASLSQKGKTPAYPSP